MGKVIRLTESQLTRIIENVIKEQQDDLELQAAAQELKQKTGEAVSTEDLKASICTGGEVELDMGQVPQELQKPAQTAFQQLKAKAKTASVGELIKALRNLRKLAKQGQQQNNEQEPNITQPLAATVAGGTVVAILGVPMTIPLAVAIFGSGLLLILYAIIASIRGERKMPRVGCAAYGHGQYNTKSRGQINKVRRGVGNVGMRKI